MDQERESARLAQLRVEKAERRLQKALARVPKRPKRKREDLEEDKAVEDDEFDHPLSKKPHLHALDEKTKDAKCNSNDSEKNSVKLGKEKEGVGDNNISDPVITPQNLEGFTPKDDEATEPGVIDQKD